MQRKLKLKPGKDVFVIPDRDGKPIAWVKLLSTDRGVATIAAGEVEPKPEKAEVGK